MATRIPVIVIDPGHGGTEKVGGSSPNNATGPNGLLEKDLTLDVARRVASSLAGRAEVLLTRADDSNLSLADRAAVALKRDARLFLSIHFNGFKDPKVDGTEVFVARRASDASRGFAQRVLSHLLAVTQVTNRGVKEEDMGVLLPGRHAKGTLACLAEVAFLSNPAQARRLESAEYRRKLAAALEEAIEYYLPSENYLHRDAVRPDRRVPAPAPFGLSATHTAETYADPWAPASALSEPACGCAGCAECAPAVARGLGICESTKDIPACELVADYQPLTAKGSRTPNLFLRWNDIPQGTCKVDVVVHFHGWAASKAEAVKPMTIFDKILVSGLDFDDPAVAQLPQPGRTIDPAKKCKTQGQTKRKGRPTLCILPLGRYTPSAVKGANVRAFDHPLFDGRGAAQAKCSEAPLQKLVSDSLDLLASANGLKDVTFIPGRLILTAHSGGGAVLSRLLRQRDRDGFPCNRPNEVHLFDATYSDVEDVYKWANERIKKDAENIKKGALKEAQMTTVGGALRVLYRPCGSPNWKFVYKNTKDKSQGGQCKRDSETETGAREIQRRLVFPPGSPAFLQKFYRVEKSPVGHMGIPGTYGHQLLENAGADLKPAPSPAPAPNDPKAKPACCPQWPHDCTPKTCAGMPEPQPAPAGGS